MVQLTRRQLSHQIDSFRNSTLLPFHEILDPRLVDEVLTQEQVTFCERIYTPLITLCLFLFQVLSPDHSCREAVARLIAWRVSSGRKACSAETNTYCEARQRLPLRVVQRLVRHCQWTRIVTRLVNPNCYEARPSADRAATSGATPLSCQDYQDSCSSPRVLWTPARPNRGQ